MKSKLWILAALVGAVAIWLALWNVTGFPDSSSRATEISSPIADEGTFGQPAEPATDEREIASGTRSRRIEASLPVVGTDAAPEAVARIRLHGTLLHAGDGTPLASPCALRIVDQEWEEISLETKPGGGYEFVDLHAGTWEITATAQGFVTLRTSVVLDREEKEKRLDLPLRPALIVKVRIDPSPADSIGVSATRDGLQISARVLSSSLPSGVLLDVVATKEEPPRWLEEAGRNPGIGRFLARGNRDARQILRGLGYLDGDVRVRLADGSDLLELPPEYCGVLELSESPPAFASLVVQGLVLRTVPIAAGADDVSFSISAEDLEKLPSRIRLKVVDAEVDAPPAGLLIHFGEGSMRDYTKSQESDGSVIFGGFLPGPVTLKITASDREAILERILVQPGTTMELGTYRMDLLSLIQARVIDDDGKPASVMFNVFPLDRYDATRETLAQRIFRSSREGELKIDSVGRGRYLIVANEPGWTCLPALADTSFRQKDRIEIRASRGTSVVLRLRAEPPPDARFAIRTSAGMPVADRKCSGRDPMRFLLAAGSYSAELHAGETWLWSENLVVGKDPVRRFLPR